MPRKLSTIAPDWWDYTTLEDDLIRDAAALSPTDLEQLSRPGFRVVMYDTLEDFYLAEALEYIDAWRQATTDNPVGIPASETVPNSLSSSDRTWMKLAFGSAWTHAFWTNSWQPPTAMLGQGSAIPSRNLLRTKRSHERGL